MGDPVAAAGNNNTLHNIGPVHSPDGLLQQIDHERLERTYSEKPGCGVGSEACFEPTPTHWAFVP